ncbi:hypothetical protein GQ457_16G008130 [Hibiscus cannabinus]
MVNTIESIRSLQDTSSHHEQTLTNLENHVANQEKWNAATQTTIQDMARQLQNISTQLRLSAMTSVGGELTADSTINRGKAKMRVNTDDSFLFPLLGCAVQSIGSSMIGRLERVLEASE